VFSLQIGSLRYEGPTILSLTEQIENILSVLTSDILRQDGSFDMALCLKKFAEHFCEIFTEDDAAFYEQHGRFIFISYLRPLINDRGSYHFESALTDQRRMDIVVDYYARNNLSSNSNYGMVKNGMKRHLNSYGVIWKRRMPDRLTFRLSIFERVQIEGQ
jgi:hypothetical protein